MATKASKIARMKRKAEMFTTFAKFGLVFVSGYMLYQKWQKQQAEEAAIAAAQASTMDNEAGGVTGATRPLAVQTNEPLPHAQDPMIVPYSNATPDKVATSRALATPTMKPLDPNAIANNAISSLTSAFN
jgi:hypothetical protein